MTKNSSNNNKNTKRLYRPKTNQNVLKWAMTPPSIFMRMVPSIVVKIPIPVIQPILMGGSTGVTTATGTNLSAGSQALIVTQINAFSTRFAGFREYLITKVRVCVQAVNPPVTAFSGFCAFWLDEDASGIPGATSLDDIQHLSLSISNSNNSKAEFIWRPHDFDEVNWNLLSVTPSPVAYLKWYGDSTNTGLGCTNGVQLFMIDYYYEVAFRGIA
jgi:hypothetical protein